MSEAERLDPPDDEIGRHFAAESEITPAPAEMRARVWERLATNLMPPPGSGGAGTPSPNEPSPSTPASSAAPSSDASSTPSNAQGLGGLGSGGLEGASAASAARAWSLFPIAAASTVAFVAGGATVWVGTQWLAPAQPADESAAPSAAPMPVPESSGEPERGSSTAPAPEQAPAPARPAAPPPVVARPRVVGTQSVRSRPTAVPAGGAGSEREQRLLQTARAALARGNTSSARRALDQHRSDFPQGTFSEEREMLNVLLFVREARRDEARRAADRFHARYPQSMHRAALERALREAP